MEFGKTSIIPNQWKQFSVVWIYPNANNARTENEWLNSWRGGWTF